MLSYFKKFFKEFIRKEVKQPDIKILKPIDNRPVLTINRRYMKDCTLGDLYSQDGCFQLSTLEEPWVDNQPNISCIPEGLYRCLPHNGPKWQDVWELINVANRKGILIGHPGNTTDDIEGCILLGLSHGTLEGRKAVLRSKDAITELKNYIGRDGMGQLKPFWLNIVSI